MEIINSITKNVLMALYQSFGFSVLIATLFMFFELYAKEHGYKRAICDWKEQFIRLCSFRKTFALALYSAMILFRTLFNRSVWVNPLSDIFGGWTIYNTNGELTTENIENLMLFIPFTVLLLWKIDSDGVKSKSIRIVWYSLKMTLVFSALIEFTQLFFKLGTFQFSDIFLILSVEFLEELYTTFIKKLMACLSTSKSVVGLECAMINQNK